MPRQLTQDVANNFSGGLITQATGLNFPPNACSDSLNCIHHELGFIQPRPGFDFEENYTTKTINRTSSAVTTYFWRNVTGDGTINLLVSQVGSALYFYLPSNITGFSAGALSTTVDLTTYMPSGAPSPGLSECQFSTGLGYLFVTHPTLEPFYVAYDVTLQTVSSTQIHIQVRDTEGIVDDGLAVSERPASLDAEHNYNILNQGWWIKDEIYLGTFAGATATYPSNSDVWWTFKNFDDVFDVTTVDSIYFAGTTYAPRGHYILNAFDLDRTAISGIPALDTVSSGYQRPAATAFYSGRVWYAGTSANGYESKIYFSQILKDVKNAGNCYQREDPTDENFDALEPDDGGWLVIPGVGLVYKLVPLGNNLIVFGSQGIYQIGGSVGTGFTALDYSDSFLSSVRPLSATSFVDVDGFPAWWTIEGIYLLSPGNQSSALVVQSLTDQKIKDLFLQIPLACKRFARGAYDPRSHTIQWIYRDTAPTSLGQTYEFNSILNYNVLGQAFYPWTVSTDDVAINSIFLTEGFGASIQQDDINVGAADVVSGGADVIDINLGSAVLEFANKFFVSYPNSGSYKFTFADYANTNYLDWEKFLTTGEEYTATFTTGPKIPTQGSKRFGASYINIFSDLSSIGETDFYFQPIWNYANTGNSGKIPNRQRVTYSSGQYFDIVRNRLKVRGAGYAIQHRFTGVPGKPFHIIGYTVSESVESRD